MEQKIDLRIKKTYHLLHLAFTELLEEKSLEEITVGELCDRAMLRRNTFYLHFADKYEYFYFYLSELRDEFRSHILSDNETTTPLTYSVKMLHELFRFVLAHQTMLENLKNSNRLSFLYIALQEQIALEIQYTVIEMNHKKSSTDLDLIISFYSGGIINIIYWWLDHPQLLTEAEITERIISLFPTPIELLK